MRWAGHAAFKGEKRNAYRVLVGRPERKRPLGRHRCRWENNIGWVIWTCFTCLRIETSGWLL
jgi:hypothetical protein